MEPQQFHPTPTNQPAEQSAQSVPAAAQPPTSPPPGTNSAPPQPNEPQPAKKKKIIRMIAIVIGVIIAAGLILTVILLVRSFTGGSSTNPSSSSSTSTSTKSAKQASAPAVMPTGYTLFETPCYSFGLRESNATADDKTTCEPIGLAYGQNTGDDLSVNALEGNYKTVNECASAHQSDITAETSGYTREVVATSNITLDDTSAVQYITDKKDKQPDDITKRARIVAFNPDKSYDLSSGKTASCFLVENSYWDKFTVEQTNTLVSTWRWKY